MNTITAPQDAQIQVGGTGGYLVNSSSNILTGVMPGVSINLVSAQASGSSPVTISVAPDGNTMAGLVQSMVTAANKALTDINTYAGYNAKTKSAGPLMGDPNLNAITTQIEGVIAGVGSSFGATNASTVGLNLTSAGQITFDKSTFLSAYQANPTAVTNLFAQGGSLTPASSTYSGTASLVSAGDGTQPGSYPVVITQSATQANDLGLVSSTGTITNAETITVSSGSLSASYAATAGESFSSIAAGLNTALSTAGIGVGAQDLSVTGGSQLSLTSGTYGSAANFSVTSTAVGTGQTGLATTANVAQSFTGIDVAGTINGVAATGSGQTLTAPYTDPNLAGLALNITATGITSATDIGSFNYQPGIAGGLAFQANGAVSSTNGTLTDTIQNLNSQITNLQQQYNSYTPMLLNEQKMLQQEFSTMETQMSGLVNQGSWLASQIKNLP
jgi:flagellar hook-associated protein 2